MLRFISSYRQANGCNPQSAPFGNETAFALSCADVLCALHLVTDLDKEKFSRLRRSSRIALMDYIFAYPTVITEESQEKAHSFSPKHQLLYVDIYEGNIRAVGSTAQPRLMKN